MYGLRDTSRQLIPNLGEWFKQFKTSRVIRGIKIFLQSTWSYKKYSKNDVPSRNFPNSYKIHQILGFNKFFMNLTQRR